MTSQKMVWCAKRTGSVRIDDLSDIGLFTPRLASAKFLRSPCTSAGHVMLRDEKYELS